jgi:hypothetical protein
MPKPVWKINSTGAGKIFTGLSVLRGAEAIRLRPLSGLRRGFEMASNAVSVFALASELAPG